MLARGESPVSPIYFSHFDLADDQLVPRLAVAIRVQCSSLATFLSWRSFGFLRSANRLTTFDPDARGAAAQHIHICHVYLFLFRHFLAQINLCSLDKSQTLQYPPASPNVNVSPLAQLIDSAGDRPLLLVLYFYSLCLSRRVRRGVIRSGLDPPSNKKPFKPFERAALILF
jgi:hypothetical protein